MRVRKMFREAEEGAEPSALRDQGQRAGAASLLLPFLTPVRNPKFMLQGHGSAY